MNQKASLRTEAYKFVRSALANGKLKAGSRVSTQSLADDIGISRTPVAEALLILEHEGFLERFPRSASVVRQPDQWEISELYELRLALESYAAENTAKNATAKEISTLKSFLDKMKECLLWLRDQNHEVLDTKMLNQYLSSDAAFHMLLVKVGGNTKITKVISDAHVFTKIFCFPRERQDHQNFKNVMKAYKHHANIYRAIKKRDGYLAGKLMKNHIRKSKQASLDFVEKHYRQQKQDVLEAFEMVQ
jgi:DNA-binding GntR family transcriptional regulator